MPSLNGEIRVSVGRNAMPVIGHVELGDNHLATKTLMQLGLIPPETAHLGR